MKTTKHLLLILSLCALALNSLSMAADILGAPGTIDYQGRVIAANGNPLAPSAPENFEIQFRIYDAQTGGTTVWAEKQVVTVFDGSFSVRLGEGLKIAGDLGAHALLEDAFQGKERFLGVTVLIPGETPGEISPRLAFLASPFSYVSERALVADKVDGTGSSSLGSTTISALTVSGSSTLGAVTGTFSGSGANLTNLSASNITGGFSVGQIPNLDASKITTGTLTSARIQDLAASKITSGTLNSARIPTLDASKIPNLDASKINTGTMNVLRIPNLDASKITAGTFPSGRIPTTLTNDRVFSNDLTVSQDVTVSGNSTVAGNSDVKGDLKLGSAGQYHATGGTEELKIVRGTVDLDGDVLEGTGYSVTKGSGNGSYTIAFSPSFSGSNPPSITVTTFFKSTNVVDRTIALVDAVTAASAVVKIMDANAGTLRDVKFGFIAVGPK